MEWPQTRLDLNSLYSHTHTLLFIKERGEERGSEREGDRKRDQINQTWAKSEIKIEILRKGGKEKGEGRGDCEFYTYITERECLKAIEKSLILLLQNYRIIR